MTPYTWGLVVVALVAYALGTRRVHRLFVRPTFRALQRRARERSVQALLQEVERRHVRLVIETNKGSRVTVGEARMGEVGRTLLDLERIGDPFGAAKRHYVVEPGESIVCELTSSNPLDDAAELARFDVIRGAA